ncbi:MAG: hypothetical protein H0W67_05005 [Gemmatimonadales bacterium]|nr:hypothetical protein [Gemmatimonadales bacterium]
MRRSPPLLLALAVGLGCSSLTATDGGVIALEVPVPNPATIETGDTLRLTARALNASGDPVDIPVTWLTADTTITLGQSTGLVTGRTPGTARVQAALGSLTSSLLTITIVARPDTLVLASDSSLAVAADQPASPALTVRVESTMPAVPVPGVAVVFTVVEPVFADPALRTVELSGGVLTDTLTTGEDGQTLSTVNRVAGVVTPDSVLVEVRALRTTGDTVPGSGQRFKVRFPI